MILHAILTPLATALLTAAAVASQPDAPTTGDLRPESVVISDQVGEIGGRRQPYIAELGQIPIRDVATGEAHGFMFYTAFRLPVPQGGKPRPVTFVWNGGPGADSTTLDFHVAGPKRVVDGRLVDNPETWLAATDLVFVDPIGTGFSRPAKVEYEKEFYGTVGDVASVTEFVRAWRLVHGAEDAPLYLVGESWGAGRAGSVGYSLQKRGVEVSGLVLISGGAGLNTAHLPRALGEALRITDLEETARYHHKLPPDSSGGADATRREAEAFARTTYAPALDAPASLTAVQRADIVAGLTRYTGLAPTEIDSQSLRITPRAYRQGLLKAEGKTLNTFDMRVTGGGAEASDAAPILRFIRHDLGYSTEAPYVGLEPLETGYAPGGHYPEGVGEQWNYATKAVSDQEVAAAIAEARRTGGGPPRLGPTLPSVEELVALNPRVKVLVAAGRYDSLNSCTANQELGRRLSGAVAAAIRFRCYGGGHMMYTDDAARLSLSRDVTALIAASR